jgi:predicted NBD/HSP70 family sugar kinase
MASPRVIALDLGGTKLLSGVVDDEGVVEKRVVGATDTSSEDAVLAQVEEAVEGLLEEGTGAIGMGIPSTIDQRRGEAIDSVNIPLSDVPLRDRLGAAVRPACRDRERCETQRRSPSTVAEPAAVPGTWSCSPSGRGWVAA